MTHVNELDQFDQNFDVNIKRAYGKIPMSAAAMSL